MLRLNKTILFLVFFSLLFTYKLKVKANLFGDYVPQENVDVEQRRTVGSGSRSNCKSNIAKKSVTLLVPEQKVIHLTSMEKPSFFLIADKLPSRQTFRFTLIDPIERKTLVEKNFSVSEGIKEIELNKSTQLKLDRVYLWYVGIPCTNNQEDYREVLGAAIKRTKPSKSVTVQLRQAKDDLQAAAVYAENGFWYEALEIAIREPDQDKQDTQEKYSDYLERLLLSADSGIKQKELQNIIKLGKSRPSKDIPVE